MDGYYSEEELLKFGFKQAGGDILLSRKASIYQPEKISIGNHVRIDDYCFLAGCVTLGDFIHLSPYASIHGTGGGTVELKDFAGLSSYSAIYAGSDDYSGEWMTNSVVDEEFKKIEYSDIVLEKHALVGMHSVLLPGAYLAEGCAVGAMSFLSKKTEPWGIYAGIPARRLKERKRGILNLEEKFLKKKSREYDEVLRKQEKYE